MEQPAKPRSRGSFVLKLTASQSFRMFRLLLTIDLLILLLFGGLLVVQCEHTLGVYLPENRQSIDSESLPELAISIQEGAVGTHQKAVGIGLPRALERALDLPEGQLRAFAIQQADDAYILRKGQNRRLVYTVATPTEDGRYRTATINVTLPVRWFAYGMAAIVAVELLMLLTHTVGASRGIRRTLAPIQQLAAATRQISRTDGTLQTKPHKRALRKKATPGGEADASLKLSGTIDTLNKITAAHLDTRIPLEGERAELRGLAAAINGMLDRLDAAYSSQMRFVSDASHELRTPISVLQGYANLLDRWGKDDPAVLQESIEAIKAEAEGMQVLVEQLLFLARGDNNTIPLQVQRVNAADLTEEVLRETRMISKEHLTEAELDNRLWLEGDEGLLKQALRIFVDNAIKYSPAGSVVRAAVFQQDEWVKIAITDNGIGIVEEDLPHVLERFYRSDESRARSTGGTGLGLSIAQWIVERHGGYLEILSREGLGTRLTMVLPMMPALAEKDDENKPQTMPEQQDQQVQQDQQEKKTEDAS